MPDRLVRIALPRRAPNYKVALTPLADAMFQLLVFFMLSSNISPYALLPLRSGALAGGAADAGRDAGQGADQDAGREGGTAPARPGAPLDPGETAVWTVGRDALTAGGQRFAFDRLPDLARTLAASGTARVLLVARADAQVQGLVAVAEALARAGIAEVQVASLEGGAS